MTLEEGLLSSPPYDQQRENARSQEFVEEEGAAARKSSALDCVWNLSNSILGAGMFALPRVYAALGLIGGTAVMALVALLTHLTIVVMIRSSEKHDSWTYASTMQKVWGTRAAASVHAAVGFGCVGFVALYMIVTCDVLVGNAEYTGILPDLFPALFDPLPWWLSRSALLTWIALASAPLLSAHTLHGMAATSAVSVACSTLAMLCLLGLWGAAAFRGVLAPMRWFPDLSYFGHTPAVIATRLVATLPVVMTAFICHMTVHPVSRDLETYTPRRMRSVVAWSLGACGVLYAATGASGFSTFGSGVSGDVLSNVQPEAVAKIFGCSDARGLAFVAALKACVAAAMLTSVPINLWPVREEVLGLLTAALGGVEPSRRAFYTVTYACLGAIWALAVAVRSAYAMIGLVGATCGIAMAFLFPGMLAWQEEGGKGLGAGLLGTGAVLMVAGVGSTLLGIDQ